MQGSSSTSSWAALSALAIVAPIFVSTMIAGSGCSDACVRHTDCVQPLECVLGQCVQPVAADAGPDALVDAALDGDAETDGDTDGDGDLDGPSDGDFDGLVDGDVEEDSEGDGGEDGGVDGDVEGEAGIDGG